MKAVSKFIFWVLTGYRIQGEYMIGQTLIYIGPYYKPTNYSGEWGTGT